MKKNISRRSVVRGAAWSVPAIAAVTAAPAYAASNGPLTVTITSSCTSGTSNTGTFTVNVTGLDPTETVQVILSSGGGGTFTATGGGAFSGQSGTTYTLSYAATNNGTATGTISVTFANNQGAIQTVTARATFPPSTTTQAQASITTTRSGNSANYTCTSA